MPAKANWTPPTPIKTTIKQIRIRLFIFKVNSIQVLANSVEV